MDFKEETTTLLATCNHEEGWNIGLLISLVPEVLYTRYFILFGSNTLGTTTVAEI